MRHLLYIISVVTLAMISSATAYAQRDVETILHDNSLSKIKTLYGEPTESESFEGEGGDFISMLYQDFYATIDEEDNNLVGINFWTSDFCVLSSIIQGGIKVGDKITKYKDIDFSEEVTGKHYENNGFIPIAEPFSIYPSGKILNYRILSKGRPYVINFAVEKGIIQLIDVHYLQDFTDSEDDAQSNIVQ